MGLAAQASSTASLASPQRMPLEAVAAPTMPAQLVWGAAGVLAVLEETNRTQLDQVCPTLAQAAVALDLILMAMALMELVVVVL